MQGYDIENAFAKWRLMCSSLCALTHEQIEAHGWVLSMVGTDGLVLMHQNINIHSDDQNFIV